MYYEEKVIQGALHFRTNPNDSWKEKVTQHFICKHLSGRGLWVFDYDTLRKTESWYGVDWFMGGQL